MDTLSIDTIEATFVDSFEPFDGVQDFKKEVQWYIDGCQPYNSSVRIEEVTQSFVGENDPTQTIQMLIETIHDKEMDSFYRGLCERSLKILVSIEHYKTNTTTYKSKEYPHDDSIQLREVVVSEKTSLLIYHKNIFNGFIETDSYGLKAPHLIEQTIQEITSGFELIN